MAYTDVNFKTKKAFKEAIAAGRKISLYNPSGMWPVKDNGRETVEGPHYPEPHRWYASVIVKDGYVEVVK